MCPPAEATYRAGDAAPIEPGDHQDGRDDTDSTLGSDAASSSASLTSSILEYRTMHGRRYHSERGKADYWAPNDAHQNDSVDLNHHMLTLVLDEQLFLAPLVRESVKTVLDVGTGTGKDLGYVCSTRLTGQKLELTPFCSDFADELPHAEVIGTDISPIQPSWVPPNLKFEIEDCTQQWTFGSDSIDFVHLRYLVGSIKDWASLFKEAYRVCVPGGWAESYEGVPQMDSDDGTVPDDSAIAMWAKTFIKAGEQLDRPFTVLDDNLQQKGMEEAGFINIKSKTFKVPVGGWPKDPTFRQIGLFAQAHLETDMEGHVLHVANLAWKWSEQEVGVYCARLRRELRSGKHHPYFRVRVVYGQKPEESKE
ncbi:hypothetical protein ACJZ2D_000548 [Fusarium nematophilum]